MSESSKGYAAASGLSYSEQIMQQRAAVAYPTDAASLRRIVDDRDRYIESLNRLLVERAERIMALEDELHALKRPDQPHD